jgi:hypothetical protein
MMPYPVRGSGEQQQHVLLLVISQGKIIQSVPGHLLARGERCRRSIVSGTRAYDWYSVYVETRAPAGASVAAEQNAADALMDLLAENSGTVSASPSSWGATVSVRAYDAREAADTGVALIQRMAVKAGMPPWPPVRAQAVRQDVLDEDNARPTLPELVSAPEAAEILGVSPQRVHELASSPGFPEPMYDLRTGRLWLKSAISAYAKRRHRTPGRPRKTAAS